VCKVCLSRSSIKHGRHEEDVAFRPRIARARWWWTSHCAVSSVSSLSPPAFREHSSTYKSDACGGGGCALRAGLEMASHLLVNLPLSLLTHAGWWGLLLLLRLRENGAHAHGTEELCACLGYIPCLIYLSTPPRDRQRPEEDLQGSRGIF